MQILLYTGLAVVLLIALFFAGSMTGIALQRRMDRIDPHARG